MQKAPVACSRLTTTQYSVPYVCKKIFIHSVVYFKVTPCDMDITVVFCRSSDAFSIAVNI